MIRDLVKEIIETKYNRFFKCADVVNYIIAEQNGVSFKYLMDCRKRIEDPFDQFRRGLTVKVARQLAKLRDNGFIEKYSSQVWRIVN